MKIMMHPKVLLSMSKLMVVLLEDQKQKKRKKKDLKN